MNFRANYKLTVSTTESSAAEITDSLLGFSECAYETLYTFRVNGY